MSALPAAAPPHARIIGWSSLAIALLAPAFAMAFTDQVRWSPGDFAAAAVLLVGLGCAIEAAVRITRTPTTRTLAILLCAGGFALVWAELAVGLS